MVLNQESKAFVDRQELFFWQKTRGSVKYLGKIVKLAGLICKLSVKILRTDPNMTFGSLESSGIADNLFERTIFALLVRFRMILRSKDIPAIVPLEQTHFRF